MMLQGRLDDRLAEELRGQIQIRIAELNGLVEAYSGLVEEEFKMQVAMVPVAAQG
jgi:hypothetical protein